MKTVKILSTFCRLFKKLVLCGFLVTQLGTLAWVPGYSTRDLSLGPWLPNQGL